MSTPKRTMSALIESVEKWLLEMTSENGTKLFQDVVCIATDDDLQDSIAAQRGGAFFNVSYQINKKFSEHNAGVFGTALLEMAIVVPRAKVNRKEFAVKFWKTCQRFISLYKTTNEITVVVDGVAMPAVAKFQARLVSENGIRVINQANACVAVFQFSIDNVQLA